MEQALGHRRSTPRRSTPVTGRVRGRLGDFGHGLGSLSEAREMAYRAIVSCQWGQSREYLTAAFVASAGENPKIP
jgi:hypothetical protein